MIKHFAKKPKLLFSLLDELNYDVYCYVISFLSMDSLMNLLYTSKKNRYIISRRETINYLHNMYFNVQLNENQIDNMTEEQTDFYFRTNRHSLPIFLFIRKVMHLVEDSLRVGECTKGRTRNKELRELSYLTYSKKLESNGCQLKRTKIVIHSRRSLKYVNVFINIKYRKPNNMTYSQPILNYIEIIASSCDKVIDMVLFHSYTLYFEGRIKYYSIIHNDVVDIIKYLDLKVSNYRLIHFICSFLDHSSMLLLPKSIPGYPLFNDSKIRIHSEEYREDYNRPIFVNKESNNVPLNINLYWYNSI